MAENQARTTYLCLPDFQFSYFNPHRRQNLAIAKAHTHQSLLWAISEY